MIYTIPGKEYAIMAFPNTWHQALELAWQHRARLALVFFGILVPLMMFGWLAQAVWEREGFVWDRPALLWIHGFATTGRDALAVWVSIVGGVQVVGPITALAVVGLALTRRYRDAVFLTLAVGGAVVLNVTAKLAFQRHRPDLWVSPTPEHDYGFPSGHAMGSLAFALGLALLAWDTRWRWPVLVVATVFALAVGFSRLYLGVHFPSDVVAGFMASLAWVIGVHSSVHAVRLRRRV